MTESKAKDISEGTVQMNCSKGRLSYHLWVECFSQLSFDSEVYTKYQMRVVKNIRGKDGRMNSL